MTVTIDSLLEQINGLVCIKKKKAPHYRIAVNDWIVQAILDDQWGTAYHQTPPQGTPPKLYSVHDATVAALQQALERWQAEQERKAETNNEKTGTDKLGSL